MTLLEVRGLKVHYPLRGGTFGGGKAGTVKAVDGVDLAVPEGRTVGLVGESGCGKSTFGKAIMRLAPITGGTVEFDGTDLAELKGEPLRRMRRSIQMVFQDPLASLNPRQSIGTILAEPMRAHGITPSPARVSELLDQVGLPASAAAKYPHEFSGGQRQRVGIARAIGLGPRLIVADEPVSALDVSIQAQILNLMEDLQREHGFSYLMIAHDLAVVRHASHEVAVMYLGGIVEQADSETLYREPLHPYTRALMSAVPIPDPAVERGRERIVLRGDPPSPVDPPSGCRFHTRCPFRQETKCHDELPPLQDAGGGHRVACHWTREIAEGRIAPVPSLGPVRVLSPLRAPARTGAAA